jgi:hypothetical protein
MTGCAASDIVQPLFQLPDLMGKKRLKMTAAVPGPAEIR